MRQLEIRICWLGSILDLALISTATPLSPVDQVRTHEKTGHYAPPTLPMRAVTNGDRF